MMTRWSLFSVVDIVVLIFVEERKEEGTRYSKKCDDFSKL